MTFLNLVPKQAIALGLITISDALVHNVAALLPAVPPPLGGEVPDDVKKDESNWWAVFEDEGNRGRMFVQVGEGKLTPVMRELVGAYKPSRPIDEAIRIYTDKAKKSFNERKEALNYPGEFDEGRFKKAVKNQLEFTLKNKQADFERPDYINNVLSNRVTSDECKTIAQAYLEALEKDPAVKKLEKKCCGPIAICGIVTLVAALTATIVSYCLCWGPDAKARKASKLAAWAEEENSEEQNSEDDNAAADGDSGSDDDGSKSAVWKAVIGVLGILVLVVLSAVCCAGGDEDRVDRYEAQGRFPQYQGEDDYNEYDYEDDGDGFEQ